MFLRKAAGDESVEQVVALNVDVVFLVSAFGDDLNVRRIERYLAAGWEEGAQPGDRAQQERPGGRPRRGGRRGRDGGVARRAGPRRQLPRGGASRSELYFSGNRTAALLAGSSGVGKFDPPNRLLGWERQETQGLRDDAEDVTRRRTASSSRSGTKRARSRHSRHARARLWDAEGGVDETFSDVADLAAKCRFADCAHVSEAGLCRSRGACRRHALPEERFESYRKLLGELKHLELKTDAWAVAEQRKARRRFARSMRKTSHWRIDGDPAEIRARESREQKPHWYPAPARDQDFALLWAGATVSLAGDGVYVVALAAGLRASRTRRRRPLVGVAGLDAFVGIFVLIEASSRTASSGAGS